MIEPTCDATSLSNVFSTTCDDTTPRVKKFDWWNDELTELRRIQIASRRKVTRARRAKSDEVARLEADYVVAKKNFKYVMKDAKTRFLAEFIALADQGSSTAVRTNKTLLQPMVEMLPCAFLTTILKTLFPYRQPIFKTASSICLLSDINKASEIFTSQLLTGRMSSVGPQLSLSQFGFRERKFTTDAILRLGRIETDGHSRKEAVVVSKNITNAFNFLLWDIIMNGMERKRFPVYLSAIISDSLNKTLHHDLVRDDSTCEASRGSSPGSHLWNVSYDEVLGTIFIPGSQFVCFAYDKAIITILVTLEHVIDVTDVSVTVYFSPN